MVNTDLTAAGSFVGCGSHPGQAGRKRSWCWLPIRFDGDRPTIEWRDQWRMEDYA